MLNIIQLPVLENNYIYIIHEPMSGETAVIDPSLAAPVTALLEQKNWTLNYLFNTHHHWDHVGANAELKKSTHCQIFTSVYDKPRIPNADKTLKEGDHFYLGDVSFNVIETPGHTLGHIVFYCPTEKALFSGDTLFSMGCGRLFEGSAQQLWHSLQKLKKLPKDTQVYCAHEYTLNNGLFALSVEPENTQLQTRMQQVYQLRNDNKPTIPTCIDTELATNPFFREDSTDLQERLNLQGKNGIEIFTYLRHLKDVF